MTDNVPGRLRAVAEQLVARRPISCAAAGSRSSHAGVDGVVGVRTKSSPTDPVTVADTETEQLVRDRLAELRPGEPILGEEGGGPAATVPCGGWSTPSTARSISSTASPPTRCRSPRRSTACRSPARSPTLPRTEVYSAASGGGAHVTADGRRRPLACNRVGRSVDGAAGHRVRLSAQPACRASGAAGPDPAAGPRRPADRFGGVGPVPGCGRRPRRLLRARAARMGLGGRCADRRRGRARRSCCPRRTPPAAGEDCWWRPRPGWQPS